VIPLSSPVIGYSCLCLWVEHCKFIVFGWLFLRSPQHRWPVALMLAGQVAARLIYALGAVQAIQSDLPIEVIAFWFPITMYVIALFGFRLLDPIRWPTGGDRPDARGHAVVDRDGRVASLNPAASAILGLPGKQACGHRSGSFCHRTHPHRVMV